MKATKSCWIELPSYLPWFITLFAMVVSETPTGAIIHLLKNAHKLSSICEVFNQVLDLVKPDHTLCCIVICICILSKAVSQDIVLPLSWAHHLEVEALQVIHTRNGFWIYYIVHVFLAFSLDLLKKNVYISCKCTNNDIFYKKLPDFSVNDPE